MPNRSVLERLSDALVWIAAGGVLLYLVLISGRGFDITDEGYYLLSARHPEEILFSVSSEHLYRGELFRLLDYHIVRFRLLGIVALAASSILLSIGAARLVMRIDESEQPDYRGFAGMTVLGSLLYYSWHLPTPSYNLLNAFVVSTALGLLFLWLARDPSAAGRRLSSLGLLPVFAAGVFAGIGLFVKVTTALGLLLGCGLLCALWPGSSLRRNMKAGGALGLGAAAWLTFHFLVVQPWPEWWRSMREGLTAAQLLDPGRDLARTLVRGGVELSELLSDVLALWWPVLVLPIVVTAWHRLRGTFDRRRASSWAAFGGVAAIGAAAGLSFWRGLHIAGVERLHLVTRFHLGALCLLALVLWSMGLPRLRRGAGDRAGGPLLAFRQVLLVVTLSLAPLAFSFGTNNDITTLSSLYLGPWFGLYAWLCLRLERSDSGCWVAVAAKLFVVLFTGSQIVVGSWTLPYRLNGTLADQKAPTAIGSPPTMLDLDEPTSAFLDAVRTTLEANGFRPGSDLVGLFGVQGVVHAVGGRSLGSAWYSAHYPGSRAHANRTLSMVPRARLQAAFLVLTSESSGALPSLASHGMRFPQRYELCGEFDIPYPWTGESLQIWKPREPAPR